MYINHVVQILNYRPRSEKGTRNEGAGGSLTPKASLAPVCYMATLVWRMRSFEPSQNMLHTCHKMFTATFHGLCCPRTFSITCYHEGQKLVIQHESRD